MATKTTAESELRRAMRHVHEGRACVMRQQAIVGRLSDRGLATEGAESLHWFEEMQGEFEMRFQTVLAARRRQTVLGLAALELKSGSPDLSDKFHSHARSTIT
jgi:hypothetical protein